MKITFLGHSSYLIQFGEQCILVDPVLSEITFWGEAEIHPPRKLHLERFPKVTAIFISHPHPGHLDIDSLQQFDRSIPIFCPQDPILELVLKELGFANVVYVEHGSLIEWDEGSLLVTGNATDSDVKEVGCLFKSEEGTAWFTIDCVLDATIISDALQYCGSVDVFFTNYPAYMRRFFSHFAFDFPIEELEQTLSNILKIRPRLLIPAFQGLRYINDNSWVNHMMFPLTVTKFLKKVAEVNPEQNSISIDPGQILELANQVIRLDQSMLVTLLEHQQKKNFFDVTLGIPELIDRNPLKLSYEELNRQVGKFILNDWLTWLNDPANQNDPNLRPYFESNTTFMLNIVFPKDYKEKSFWVTFGENSAEILEENLPNEQPDIGMRITASCLLQWNNAEIPYFCSYFQSRQYSSVVYAARLGKDLVVCKKNESMRNPISLYFNSDINTHLLPFYKKSLKKVSL